jgi:hypothetical protein
MLAMASHVQRFQNHTDLATPPAYNTVISELYVRIDLSATNTSSFVVCRPLSLECGLSSPELPLLKFGRAVSPL